MICPECRGHGEIVMADGSKLLCMVCMGDGEIDSEADEPAEGQESEAPVVF